MVQRRGGLTGDLDPDVAALIDGAARNLAARKPKQKYDANRVRLKLDVPAWLKEALAAEAKEQDTSMNQLASYFLACSLMLLYTRDEIQAALNYAKRPSKALRINFDVIIPDDIKAAVTDGRSEP